MKKLLVWKSYFLSGSLLLYLAFCALSNLGHFGQLPQSLTILNSQYVFILTLSHSQPLLYLKFIANLLPS